MERGKRRRGEGGKGGKGEIEEMGKGGKGEQSKGGKEERGKERGKPYCFPYGNLTVSLTEGNGERVKG